MNKYGLRGVLLALGVVVLLVAVAVAQDEDQPDVYLPLLSAGARDVSKIAAETVVSGLIAPVEVRREDNGIPHIMAENEHDLIFMQGWLHAQDRLFQMDVLRRQASGTLAELLGSTVLNRDVELRTIGLRRAADRSLPLLSPETQAAFNAYAEGVNAYVSAHPLPPEYDALELTTFDPWTAVDSMAISKLFLFSLSFNLEDILLTQTLSVYQDVGEHQGFHGTALFFEDLFRSAPFDPATTVPDATGASSRLAPAVRKVSEESLIRPETLVLAEDYLGRVEPLPEFEGALEWDKHSFGSNAWAISGHLIANGRPLLANDPHLSLDTPATFYQIHLEASSAGFDVIGSSVAGTPYVVLGQNRSIAWGATVNPIDVTDVFQEQVVGDGGSPSGLSIVHLGNLEPIEPLPQTFRYNQVESGQFDDLAVAPAEGSVNGTYLPSAVLLVPRRSHGPIVALDQENGVALSVQYTGLNATREPDGLRHINLARNLEDFQHGLQGFDTGSLNWAYIDGEGNIAYFASGEMPLREDLQSGFVEGLPPYFIREGTGGNEWLPLDAPPAGQSLPFQILPAGEMPHLINPATGYFVSANNDPLGHTLDNDPLNQFRPDGGLFYLSARYDLGIRAGRIAQLIEERLSRPINQQDVHAIQADVVMLDAQVFTPHILQAFERAKAAGADPALAAFAADSRVTEAVDRLSRWGYSTPTGIEEGFDANDEEGQRQPPSEEEIDASVAATLFAVWRSQMIQSTIDSTLNQYGLPRPGSQRAVTALRHLLDNFDANEGKGASGLDFFTVDGVSDPAVRRDILILQSLAGALDLLAGPAFQDAFGGSAHQEDYRWGRLHRLVLAHPLGEPFTIPSGGGAFPPTLADLSGIPVDGGFGVIDASHHNVRGASSHDFMFNGGPAHRYVGQPAGNGSLMQGRSSLPGGESGVLGNAFYANLLSQWLINDTYPLRQSATDLASTGGTQDRFVPAD